MYLSRGGGKRGGGAQCDCNEGSLGGARLDSVPRTFLSLAFATTHFSLHAPNRARKREKAPKWETVTGRALD